MSVYQEIRSVSPDLSTPDLLRFLIKEKFAGEVMVTASLKAPSVVVLKMVADIDAATPVVFCHRGFQFPESEAYRERIIRMLGLQHVSETRGGEIDVQPGDLDHFERMWAESQDTLGRSYEIVHLNQMLAPCRCWISAVYHVKGPPDLVHRVDAEGRLIRVNPLIRWSQHDVRAFMREHELPIHPRATRPASSPEPQPEPPSYNY